MTKVAAPAMSLDASGKLAGSIVFSKWKGRNYIRQLVIPHNPKSVKQVGMRSMFAFLAIQWKNQTTGDKADWDDLAAVINASPFNAYMRENQRNWRNFLAPATVYPALRAATTPSAPTCSPAAGVRQLTLPIVHGANAPNWGYIIHRSTVTGFTPSLDNVVHVGVVDGSGDLTWIDTPLLAVAYYYRISGFMKDGKMGTLCAQVTGTPTA